ncbi:hypothetical protein [Desulfovibrio gilichinskyi]|uniref:Uncharacterized protein n=1 Tax=Desulfovibrio gilichinskyi TaxID=1519643 RepID=A0A1X7ET60_9BACT|nr:hypothetical protein [Desulfovibrio gilichinskyi]SMF39681.1 hypothetical protein SAMN06295933_3351 [Desulfovibrio gilichinskyi]
MKISRYGSGHYGNENSRTPSRAAAFRNKYSVGEILKGKLLKWEHHKLGWVQINSQSLLANISSSPDPGDVLTFVVQQLYPDIILKEINSADSHGGEQTVTPSDLTRLFVTKRAAFEAQSRNVIKKSYDSVAEAKLGKPELYLNVIGKDEQSSILFFETLKCVSLLNSSLKTATLHYMPWLMPSALNQEIVLKIKKDEKNSDNSFYELFYAFDLLPSAPMRFKIMYKKPQCGFKLLAESQNISLLLSAKLKESFPEYLGIEKIPANFSGGFLSELLSSSR